MHFINFLKYIDHSKVVREKHVTQIDLLSLELFGGYEGYFIFFLNYIIRWQGTSFFPEIFTIESLEDGHIFIRLWCY